MNLSWPRAWGEPQVSAVIRTHPEDFIVHEQLGFDCSGAGEHVFLHLQKRQLNSLDVQDRLSRLSGVAQRDIGLCGMKDRNALTRQWFSVGMAGKPEPNWLELEQEGNIQVLAVNRHSRKLRRGVHRGNRFKLILRDLKGDRADLEARFQRIATQGVPNYFGEQRFGRGGQTLQQARSWIVSGKRKLTRTKRGFYLSALRSFVFNELLAQRVLRQEWGKILDGDVCMLQGSRSRFSCETSDADITERSERGDLHPGLPLWGRGQRESGPAVVRDQLTVLGENVTICEFLERQGLDLGYRSARLMADDFCWQFCDDGNVQLEFSLGPGGYATAVLTELVQYKGEVGSGNGSE